MKRPVLEATGLENKRASDLTNDLQEAMVKVAWLCDNFSHSSYEQAQKIGLEVIAHLKKTPEWKPFADWLKEKVEAHRAQMSQQDIAGATMCLRLLDAVGAGAVDFRQYTQHDLLKDTANMLDAHGFEYAAIAVRARIGLIPNMPITGIFKDQ